MATFTTFSISLLQIGQAIQSLDFKMCLLLTGSISSAAIASKSWSIRKVKRLNTALWCQASQGSMCQAGPIFLEHDAFGYFGRTGWPQISVSRLQLKYRREMSRPDIAFDMQDNGDGTTSSCTTGKYYNGCSTYPTPVSLWFLLSQRISEICNVWPKVDLVILVKSNLWTLFVVEDFAQQYKFRVCH